MTTDGDQDDRAAAPAESQQAPEGADPLVGRQLGGYEVLERIGGRVGTAVYKARQPGTDRLVALKVLAERLGDRELAAARFEAEAAAAAAVAHPHVAAVYGWGCEEGRHFLVLEHIAGESLASVLAREERLESDRAAPLVTQLVEALGAVHAAGYAHCGIQPSNVVVTPDGDAKLVDFALARPLATGLRDGTRPDPIKAPLYYPPEAARAQPLDERSDLYQLGALFYHLLAGQPPFEGDDPEDTALRYAREDVPPLGGVHRTAPVALCRLIHRLLSREPDARYQSAQDVLEALGRVQAMFARTAALRAEAAAEAERRKAEQQPAEPPPRPTIAERAQAAREQQKRTVILSGAALGLCAVVAIVLLVVLPLWPEAPPPTSFEVVHDNPPGPPATTAAPRASGTAAPTPPEPRPPPARAVFLLAADAIRHGKTIRYEKGPERDNIGYWLSMDEWVHWDLEAAGPGAYEVRVVFAADRQCRGNVYAIRVGEQEVRGKVYDTGGWGEFVTEKIGTLTLDRAGAHTLEVRWVQPKRGRALMNLKAVTLRPVTPAKPGG